MVRAGKLMLVLLLTVTGLGFAADNSDAILGVWATSPKDEGGQAHVKIYKENGEFEGKIIWLAEPVYPPGDKDAGQVKFDRENPDPALRERPVMGLVIVKGFSYQGDDDWGGGTIYDPAKGKTYKSKAHLTDNGQVLKLRGYVGIPLFGRTTEWTRVKEPEMMPTETPAETPTVTPGQQ